MRLLTLARDLRRRRGRERQGLFVCEGVRAVEELLGSSLQPRGALVAPALEETPRGKALVHALEDADVEVARITDAELASASDTESPQGVLAIARVPERIMDDLETGERALILVLDALQDPGNVGTILRSAAALGVDATLALPGTVDLWNAKVVRSAMGAHFHHPTLSCTWDELDAFRRQRGLALWGADAAGDVVGAIPAPARLALVVGNEGGGLGAEARARADRLVALPISADVESLNVAVAAGILLYVLRR